VRPCWAHKLKGAANQLRPWRVWGMIVPGISAPVPVVSGHVSQGTTEKLLAIRYNNAAASQTAEILNVFSRRNLKFERIFARGLLIRPISIYTLCPIHSAFLRNEWEEVLHSFRAGSVISLAFLWS
jgi:hypothetical protein